MLTFGLLQRAHIVAGKHRRIGKEVDRRWEEGDDLDSARQRPIEYEPTIAKGSHDATSIPSEALSRLVKDIGIRKLMRFGLGRRILEKICRREPVETSTLLEYESKIRQYAFETSNAADLEGEPKCLVESCREEENNDKETKETEDSPQIKAPVSDPAVHVISAQELQAEAVPGPRCGRRWILGGAVGLLLVLGAMFVARRFDSH